MTTTPVLKNLDKLGRKTLYIRINDKKKRIFHNTGIKLFEKDWDGKQVRKSHPQHVQLNRKILSEILNIEETLSNADSFTEVSFKDYVMKCLNEWDKTKRGSTLRQLYSKMNIIENYHKGLMMSEITHEWLRKLQSGLYNQGKSNTTVWATFKFLRLIVRKAFLEKVIKENPFDVFKMPKYNNPKKIFLTKEQVKKIDKVCQDKKCPKRLAFVGNWFLIGCYTGLRFSDMASFNKKNIRSGRLLLYTQKTDEIVSIPFHTKLKELFERIDYCPMNIHNAYANRLIKLITHMASIEESVSFHTARHTCAVLLASQGVSMEVTAKVLGHSSLKSTSIYYKITNQTIDKEFAKIF